MLEMRGHTIQSVLKAEDSDNSDNSDNLDNSNNSDNFIEITAKNDRGELIIVVFQSVKFTVGNLKEILSKYDINLYTEFIIVCKSIMMSNLKKVENISEKIEIFTECELAFNITKHSLVPKMKKMDFIIKDNWPIMYESDPMAKFMKFKHGDFIEITQSDGTISYRLVKKVS